MGGHPACVVTVATGEHHLLTRFQGENVFLGPMSPGGRWLAYTVQENDGADIWLCDVNSGVIVRLTDGFGLCVDPEWSPDGRRLAFVKQVDAVFQVWIAESPWF